MVTVGRGLLVRVAVSTAGGGEHSPKSWFMVSVACVVPAGHLIW